MKNSAFRIRLILVSCLIYSSSAAQTNTFPENGNVGIGTLNPENGFQLDVSGLGTIGTPGYARVYLGTSDRNNAFIQARDQAINQNLKLFASSYSFEIGNVGIGTNSPSEKLEVNGRIKAGDRIYANSSSVNDLSLVQAYNSAGGASVLRSYSGTSYWDFSASQIAGGNSLFIGQGIDVSVNNAAIAIMANKNVGIGTNDPKDYKLAVNGKIRAQEIKVEASPWPDYVFDKSYQLPSLQETEKHIKEKGHLPGIPSAAEVKANGIDLGEMNAKLLQKIEELTLHLIESKKETDLFKSAISELKKENQFFKSTLEEIILKLK